MSTFSTCTSNNRPGQNGNPNPDDGDVLFETDTKNIIIWDGANWRTYNYDSTTANTLSLEFNADRLDTPYTSTATAFSFSFWMKSSDTSTYSGIILNDGNLRLVRPPNGFWYPLFRGVGGTNGNDANFPTLTTDPSHDPAKTAGSASTFFDGDWHHVVVTLGNENVSGTTTARYIMYRDGQQFVNQLCTTTNGWSNNNPNDGGDGVKLYTIGEQPNGTLPYIGKFDQMAFFESVLTPQNVTDIYNGGLGGDLLTLGFSPATYYRVGYYSNDTNGDGSVASAGQPIGIVADYSGNGNNASQSTTSKKPNYVADTKWQ